MTQVTFSQNISKKTFLSRTGSLLIRMGRSLAKRNTIIEIICSLLIILFIYTGLNKLIDYDKFKFQLGRSPFLQNFAGLIAATLPFSELLIAAALVFKRTRFVGLYSSLFLMTLFTGYVFAMLNYSYYLPCSCGGVLEALSWKDHLIFNSAYTLLALTGVILHTKIFVSKQNSNMNNASI